MNKFESIKSDTNVTHLFFNMSDTDEISWLLKRAGITDFKIYSGRKVLKNQVNELKSLSESIRNSEIEAMYGERADHIKLMPSVIISKFDVNDLYDALEPTLIGERDADYAAYYDEKAKQLQSDGLPDDTGICIMTRD